MELIQSARPVFSINRFAFFASSTVPAGPALSEEGTNSRAMVFMLKLLHNFRSHLRTIH